MIAHADDGRVIVLAAGFVALPARSRRRRRRGWARRRRLYAAPLFGVAAALAFASVLTLRPLRVRPLFATRGYAWRGLVERLGLSMGRAFSVRRRLSVR